VGGLRRRRLRCCGIERSGVTKVENALWSRLPRRHRRAIRRIQRLPRTAHRPCALGLGIGEERRVAVTASPLIDVRLAQPAVTEGTFCHGRILPDARRVFASLLTSSTGGRSAAIAASRVPPYRLSHRPRRAPRLHAFSELCSRASSAHCVHAGREFRILERPIATIAAARAGCASLPIEPPIRSGSPPAAASFPASFAGSSSCSTGPSTCGRPSSTTTSQPTRRSTDEAPSRSGDKTPVQPAGRLRSAASSVCVRHCELR